MKVLALIAFAVGIVWAIPSGADCMHRNVRDGKGGEHGFVILVPADQVTTFEKKGFVLKQCALTAKQMVAARISMCRMAGLKGESIQRHFEEMIGESLGKMCALASKVVDAEK